MHLTTVKNIKCMKWFWNNNYYNLTFIVFRF